MVESAAPTSTAGLLPRASAKRPAIGRQARPVTANAPVTIPTATSPESSGPVT
jgi:hypothetical protein